MDCNHARFLLNFVRPERADLDAQDFKDLQTHLQSCSECGPLARIDAEGDRAIATAMANVPAPAGLKERVLGRLSASTPVRSRWRWTAVATAAVVLIAAGSWLLWPEALPRINWDDYEAVSIHGPADIESWFADKGVDMAAPRQFNYGLLSSFDSVLFQGRRVPRLLFARGAGGRVDIAEVFVVSDKQFDLENLPPSGPSGRSMSIEYPDKPGFAFLILYSGDSLDTFRRRAEVARE